MKLILEYICNFLRHSNKTAFLLTSLFCALLIFFNYHFSFYQEIQSLFSYPVKLFTWAGVFMVALVIPVVLQPAIRCKSERFPPQFYIFILLASLIFALKTQLTFHFNFTDSPRENMYWNTVIYWPLLLLIVFLLLLAVRFILLNPSFQFGLSTAAGNLKPYLLILLIMIPLIGLAASQQDFQTAYPRLTSLLPGMKGHLSWWQILLFELSYGTDFITIELFFRGFLLLSLVQWLGKDAILPAAVFYCSIHFGKPLGECISSYFGGLLLGIVVYHTKSIRGGLLVHLGIAWLMEIAGIISRQVLS